MDGWYGLRQFAFHFHTHASTLSPSTLPDLPPPHALISVWYTRTNDPDAVTLPRLSGREGEAAPDRALASLQELRKVQVSRVERGGATGKGCQGVQRGKVRVAEADRAF